MAQPEFPAPGTWLSPTTATVPAAVELLCRRRSPPAHAITAPGPDRDTLETIVQLALRVPDHGRLEPWRLIALTGDQRGCFMARLARIAAAQERPAKAEAALARVYQAPTTIVVVSRPIEGRIPQWEQELSAGALCMNLLLAATACGFAASWLTGWAAYDSRVHDLLGLDNRERIAGYIHMGSCRQPVAERPRAVPDRALTFWKPPAGK